MFLVPQISTDAHRFFLHSPDVSSHADFADFLPFYLFTFLPLKSLFTLLPLKVFFTFRKLYKMLIPKVSFLPMKHLNHRNETISLNYFLYICGMKGLSVCRRGRLCMSGKRLRMTGERIRMLGERLCMTVEFPMTARWGLPHPSG